MTSPRANRQAWLATVGAVALGLVGAVLAVFALFDNSSADRHAAHLRRRLQGFGVGVGGPSELPGGPSETTVPMASSPGGLQCPPREANFFSVSPTCTACAGLQIKGPDRCKIDVSRCQAVEPGGSCVLSCLTPYVGTTTIANCSVGNSNPMKRLDWEMPNCTCEDPEVLPEGYVKVREGVYACAKGYAPTYEGAPEKRCGCNEEHGLQGCALLKPCAPPNVDLCRFDVEACNSVMPGGTCEIDCKEPAFSRGKTIASCKANNTDPLRELYWFPLRCMMVSCDDPPIIPDGYKKTEDGWVCAEGYHGKVVKECSPGEYWSKNCSSTTKLTGCDKIVNCYAPQLEGLDACAFDVSVCTSTEPNSTCQVFCKSPYTGDPSTALCPDKNVDHGGLQWTKPDCKIMECDEPATVPYGYIKATNLVGYDCAASYTGFPKKECVPTLSCQPLPTLVGCTQLIPCRPKPEALKLCQYSFANCGSVPPGGECVTECKVPFVGNSSKGYCTGSNTDAFGLVWDNDPPKCTMGTACPLPSELPVGYAPMPDGKEAKCDTGYTGTVTKACNFDEETCRTVVTFSGCTKMLPCLPYVPEGIDKCIRNVTDRDCDKVESGQSCQVTCARPFSGAPVVMHCPDNNIDPERELEANFTECECPDPSPAPYGYNQTGEGEWKCANGFVGTPRKFCRPTDECVAQPTLTGCTPPVPCAGMEMIDLNPTEAIIDGVIFFGPALVDSAIDESRIVDYKIWWADECNVTFMKAAEDVLVGELSPLATEANLSGAGGNGNFTCCRPDFYRALIEPIEIPERATQILIIPTTFEGPSPDGLGIRINDLVVKVAQSDSNTRIPSFFPLALAALAATAGWPR